MDPINQPLKILTLLDDLLNQEIEIIIIGRSALALGYDNPKMEFQATMDIDSIIPESYLGTIESNFDFWTANEKLNTLLDSEGLYFTHIFVETQIIIRPDWEKHKISLLNNHFHNIKLFRPHTIDLILTKMMRNDPEDFSDIEFLLSKLHTDEIQQLPEHISNAKVPSIPEIQDLFNLSKIRLDKILTK
jgi:hypothetical protein